MKNIIITTYAESYYSSSEHSESRSSRPQAVEQSSLQGKQARTIVLRKSCIIIFLFVVFGFLIFSSPVFATPINEAKLIDLANRERINHDLKPVTVNPLLYFAALTKAQDMLKKNYFEHYTPEGKSPWTFIQNAGYNYAKAGENLAMDFRTSEAMHSAWMASIRHRQNILNPDYENIGLAAVKGNFNGHETTMVVEMFGKKNQSFLNPFSSFVSTITNYIVGF